MKIDGVPDVAFTIPPQIHAGDSFVFTYTYNDSVAAGAPDDTMKDLIEPIGPCDGRICQAKYTSTHGTGTSTITFNLTGYCFQKNSVSRSVTILP